MSFNELQLDEYWSFVRKKQYNLSEIERLNEEIGDIWTFTAVLPNEKLILAHQTGKRTALNAHKLLIKVRRRSNYKKTDKLFITSDGYNQYLDAILSVFGEFHPVSKEVKQPKNLCYAQVVKKIEKGRCVKVDKSLILGNKDLLDKCLENSLVSNLINTFAVERINLTLRQHNHRIERKSQGFSKKLEYMENHTTLTIQYYNLCLDNSALTEYKGDQTILSTPAMAAKITNHKWSMEELLGAGRNYDEL